MNVLPLFPDLPAPGPKTEPEVEIPASLLALVEAGLPGEVAVRLYEAYPGAVLSVPQRVPEGHHLEVNLGPEGAAALARLLGGGRLIVPNGAGLRRRVRNEMIRRAYDGKAAVREICRRFGVTERTVWSVLGRG